VFIIVSVDDNVLGRGDCKQGHSVFIYLWRGDSAHSSAAPSAASTNLQLQPHRNT
jgi:hypothetical protein